MTKIDIYIRTQNLNKPSVKVRFRLREKSVVLNYTSDIEVPPKMWDTKIQRLKPTGQLDISEVIRLNNLITERAKLLLSIYHNSNKVVFDSDWFSNEIDKSLQPKTVQSPKKSVKSIKPENNNLTQIIDEFLLRNSLSEERKRTYRVVKRSLERFQYFKSLSDPNFSASFVC